MRKFTWLALLCSAALAACGGDDGGDRVDARITPMDGGGPPDSSGPQPDAPPPQDCDTITQTDCLTMEEPKCTVVQVGQELQRDCVPLDPAAVGINEPCTRTPLTGPMSVGHDNCDKGLFCSALSFAIDPMTGVPVQRACRAFCRDNAGCTTAGQKCLILTDMLTPQDGICFQYCNLFTQPADPGGCPDQMGNGTTYAMGCTPTETADPADQVGYCTVVGPAGPGSACGTGMPECQRNLMCVGQDPNYTCEELCDTAGGAAGMHVCQMGTGTCMPIQGFPAGIGACL